MFHTQTPVADISSWAEIAENNKIGYDVDANFSDTSSDTKFKVGELVDDLIDFHGIALENVNPRLLGAMGATYGEVSKVITTLQGDCLLGARLLRVYEAWRTDTQTATDAKGKKKRGGGAGKSSMSFKLDIPNSVFKSMCSVVKVDGLPLHRDTMSAMISHRLQTTWGDMVSFTHNYQGDICEEWWRTKFLGGGLFEDLEAITNEDAKHRTSPKKRTTATKNMKEQLSAKDKEIALLRAQMAMLMEKNGIPTIGGVKEEEEEEEEEVEVSEEEEEVSEEEEEVVPKEKKTFMLKKKKSSN